MRRVVHEFVKARNLERFGCLPSSQSFQVTTLLGCESKAKVNPRDPYEDLYTNTLPNYNDL